MLNPVVLPLPLALAVIAALALAAHAYRRWLEDTVTPWTGQPRPAKRRSGRHRLTRAAAADPNRRDWAALAAERLTAPPRRPALAVIPGGTADWRQPLTDFERHIGVLEVAGHDDHPMPRGLAARIEKTRSRSGTSMWSWSDDNWAPDTREMAAIR